MPTLLLTTIFLPLAGAILIWPSAAASRRSAGRVRAVAVVITLVLAAILVAGYPPDAESYAAVSIPWLGARTRRSTSTSASAWTA